MTPTQHLETWLAKFSYSAVKLSLNNKNISLCLNYANNVAYAEYFLSLWNFGAC